MTRPFSVHEYAEREIDEATAYYDLESPNLGLAFLEEVRRGVEFIARYPEAAAVQSGNIRRLPLPRFPFSLVYSCRPEEIRLLAVAHQKRRPFYWGVRK